MKKIPTLFERIFDGHRIVDITPNVYAGMEWVLNGDGIATVKWDGSPCAILENAEKQMAFYIRYDIKEGKPIPANAILCNDKPDPTTGHFPCWVPCDAEDPSNKWFLKALENTDIDHSISHTYEAIGKHFNGNPYNMDNDILVMHGNDVIEVPRTFDGIREYLRDNYIEGIVFWKDGEPQCKIKRTDFGFSWGRTKARKD